jgi:hypothetical protein
VLDLSNMVSLVWFENYSLVSLLTPDVGGHCNFICGTLFHKGAPYRGRQYGRHRSVELIQPCAGTLGLMSGLAHMLASWYSCIELVLYPRIAHKRAQYKSALMGRFSWIIITHNASALP